MYITEDLSDSNSDFENESNYENLPGIVDI